jgi:hypothetical protein
MLAGHWIIRRDVMISRSDCGWEVALGIPAFSLDSMSGPLGDAKLALERPF